MKKILLITLALLTLGSQVQVTAQKKEKEKKEKKELKWDWDGTLSKNEEIDKYLLTIDTLYNKVQAYKETFGTFSIVSDTFSVNNKIYAISCLADETGQIISRARVNWQFAQAYADGALILLDMTNAGLMSANAALTLPKLGLGAIKFAKYVKGGPAVISKGTSAIKEIRGKCLKNSRRWKEMKEGALEDAASIGYEGFNDQILKKLNKCYYVKEITEDDPEYAEIIAKYKNMTADEIASQCQGVAQKIENTTVLPEDKSKETEEELDVDKAMQELDKENA